VTTDDSTPSYYELHVWDNTLSATHTFDANLVVIIYITTSQYYVSSGFVLRWSTAGFDDTTGDGINSTIVYLLVAFTILFLVTFLVICCLFLRKFIKAYYRTSNQVYALPGQPNSSIDPLNAGSELNVVSESELLAYSPRVEFVRSLVEVGDAVCSICFDE
jgi:hypothetical protein